MSRITADFVAALARVWHRFEPPGQDMETLADMLAPNGGFPQLNGIHILRNFSLFKV